MLPSNVLGVTRPSAAHMGPYAVHVDHRELLETYRDALVTLRKKANSVRDDYDGRKLLRRIKHVERMIRWLEQVDREVI